MNKFLRRSIFVLALSSMICYATDPGEQASRSSLQLSLIRNMRDAMVKFDEVQNICEGFREGSNGLLKQSVNNETIISWRKKLEEVVCISEGFRGILLPIFQKFTSLKENSSVRELLLISDSLISVRLSLLTEIADREASFLGSNDQITRLQAVATAARTETSQLREELDQQRAAAQMRDVRMEQMMQLMVQMQIQLMGNAPNPTAQQQCNGATPSNQSFGAQSNRTSD